MLTMAVHSAKISYEEGHTYNGDWSKDGKREGKGCLCLADGTKYSGKFVNGFYNGHGVLVLSDNSRYEGSFELGKFHGYGVYRGQNGMLYEGQFKAGESNGLARLTLPDGSHGNPHCEGVYRVGVCERRCDSSEAVKKAQEAATTARILAANINNEQL